ncbi:type II secretion system protein GspM, partial [Raoultella terrigena]
MHSLRILWQQRSQREQRLLVAMALALFVGIAYYAFWQPWLDREQQWRQTLAKEQASLRWMQQQAPLL